jgi:zinc and cadmium transporter
MWNPLEDGMENTFWTALGASSLAELVTTIGIYVIRYFERWGQENTTYFICFAAGILISVSLLRIIPTAFSMNTRASIHRPNHYSNSQESPQQGAV